MTITIGKTLKAENYLSKLDDKVNKNNVNELADNLLITLHTNPIFKMAYHNLINDFLNNGTLVLTNANRNYNNLKSLLHNSKGLEKLSFGRPQVANIKKELVILKNELKQNHNSVISSFDKETGMYKIIPVTTNNFNKMTFALLTGFAKIDKK